STLLLKFKLRLECSPIRSGALYTPGVFGPQFHRWLPDGEKDAIVLDTGDLSATLKVWFERWGFVDGNLIRFDYERQEVEPEIMVQQGRLDAGPLIGLLEIRRLSQEDIASLEQDQADDARYVALEKRVIRLFYHPVNRFLSILRTQYGQYWVPVIEKWDSRKESPSAYLNRFGYPRWSLDGGKTWEVFRSGTIRLSVGALRKQQDFREYLTEEDWRETANLVQQGWGASPAASIMIEAVELFDRGYVRYSIIDAVTALEMVIGESLRQRLVSASESTFTIERLPFHIRVAIALSMGDGIEEQPYRDIIHKVRSTFFSLKLSRRFAIMANVLKIPEEDRDHTLRLIDIRNDIVHEGQEPPDNIKDEFSGLLDAFALLLPDRKLRFPLAHPGNRTMPKD
ncbi:MAG: hypothetical protein IMY83_00765, partial [Chloroflexi bacterium]|nr:hypothetical protein [Chloroflexota bacterium]